MNSNNIFLSPKTLSLFSCKRKKLRVLCLSYSLVLFLFPSLTLAQIVADDNAVFSGQPSAAGNTYTISNLNIPAGNNVVLTIMAKHSLASITNVNFNGVDYNTSNVQATANAGFQTLEIWVIPLGTLASALNNMTVTITISTTTLTYGAIAATFRNVNQSTPANNPTSSQPAGGSPINSTLNISSSFGDMLVDLLSSTQPGSGSHTGSDNTLISNGLVNLSSTSFLSASYQPSIGNTNAIGWNLFGAPTLITHLGLNLRWDGSPPDNSITASGSGCEPGPGFPVDGVYTLEGQVNGKNYYVHNNLLWWLLWCTVCGSNEVNNGNPYGWLIVNQGGSGEHFVYFNPTPSDLPPSTGWSVYLTGVTICLPPAPVLSGAVFLPVELLSFSGQAQEDHSILLNWQTGSEVNNEGFEVQHSLDGIQWEVLDFVGGYGNTAVHQDYTFIHYTPTPGTNHYYRLKQIDFDGAYEYSDVISIGLADNPTTTKLLVYPNPAKEQLHLRGIQAKQAHIIDHLGRRRLFRLMDDNSIDISNLEAGLYLLTIDTGQEVLSRRFVKE